VRELRGLVTKSPEEVYVWLAENFWKVQDHIGLRKKGRKR
jgi:hypothetical protein